MPERELFAVEVVEEHAGSGIGDAEGDVIHGRECEVERNVALPGARGVDEQTEDGGGLRHGVVLFL